MRKSPIVINLLVTITIAACVMVDEKYKEDLRPSFDFFDVDNDGYISKKDVEDFFKDRSKTKALGVSSGDLNLMKAGLLGTIKECGGERINWEQYIKFNTKDDPSISMEVVTHVQGREPVTVEKMAELWNVVDKQRLRSELNKGSLQDLVSAEEVHHYLNHNK